LFSVEGTPARQRDTVANVSLLKYLRPVRALFSGTCALPHRLVKLNWLASKSTVWFIEQLSCWMRTATTSAGNKVGDQPIPAIAHTFLGPIRWNVGPNVGALKKGKLVK
jgi:hypothetical protein